MADSLTADNLSFDGEWQPDPDALDPDAIARAIVTDDGDRYEVRALAHGLIMMVRHRRPESDSPYMHAGIAEWENLSRVAEIVNRHRADIWHACTCRRVQAPQST